METGLPNLVNHPGLCPESHRHFILLLREHDNWKIVTFLTFVNCQAVISRSTTSFHPSVLVALVGLYRRQHSPLSRLSFAFFERMSTFVLLCVDPVSYTHLLYWHIRVTYWVSMAARFRCAEIQFFQIFLNYTLQDKKEWEYRIISRN